jgi:hypothetical protein
VQRSVQKCIVKSGFLLINLRACMHDFEADRSIDRDLGHPKQQEYPGKPAYRPSQAAPPAAQGMSDRPLHG